MCNIITLAVTYSKSACAGVRKKLKLLVSLRAVSWSVNGRKLSPIISTGAVSSTSSDDSDVMKAKWLSLSNHIHDVRSGHGAIFMSVRIGYYRDMTEMSSCNHTMQIPNQARRSLKYYTLQRHYQTFPDIPDILFGIIPQCYHTFRSQISGSVVPGNEV